MIRVALFAPMLVTGGTQRHLQHVAAGLDRARFGARVYTLVPGGEVEGQLRASGIDVASLCLGPRLMVPRTARAIMRVAATLRAEGVQIVHGYQWRPALVGAIVARIAGVPLVLASKRSLTGRNGRERQAWRCIARRVDTIIVNADALRVEGQAQRISARWALIPSGVDVERFASGPAAVEAKRALGLDPERPVVGTIGRLEVRKRQGDLLEAVSRLVQRGNGLHPHVLIVGAGPLRDQLTRRAMDLGLTNIVRFTGAHADVRIPLAAIDVFVLPSSAEGMSNALLEAMAARRPVVATAVGGTREVLDDASGILVPPGDTAAMADAVLQLLTNPLRAARLGDTARRRVEDQFSARAMMARLEYLYSERLAAVAST